jgi:hypothetical protein
VGGGGLGGGATPCLLDLCTQHTAKTFLYCREMYTTKGSRRIPKHVLLVDW